MNGVKRGMVAVMAFVVGLFLSVGIAQAQVSASNLVANIEDNVNNATTTVGPLALGLLLLSVGIGAALYVWRLKRGGK